MMKTYFFSFLLLAVVGVATASAQNEAFDSFIRLGIQFHEEEEYENAIKSYEQALTIIPDSKLAYYEIAYSYSMMKKYDEAIRYGQMGLASADNSNPQIDIMLAMLLGSAYDDSGQPEKAIRIFDELLKVKEDYLLYYNKGLTLLRMNRPGEALDCYKKALNLNIDHAGSTLHAAKIYLAAGDHTSAFFYYVYFLILEPQTERSAEALSELFSMEGSGEEELSPYRKMLKRFKLIYSLEGKADVNKPVDELCTAYYAPFFFGACRSGHLETLARYLTIYADEESFQWLIENEEKVNALSDWLNAFAGADATGE